MPKEKGDVFRVAECPIQKGCICDEFASLSTQWTRRKDLHFAWSSFLSSAWCINLMERHDRFVETCDELHRSGLCRLVLFHQPERATIKDLIDFPIKDIPGYLGCWRSHRSVCIQSLVNPSENKLASEKNKLASENKLALILEDDVKFDHALMKPEIILTIGRYLRTGCHADMFFLGHMAIHGGFPKQLLDNDLLIMNVRSVLLHAYIMTEQGLKRFVKEGLFGADGEIAVDQWMMRHLTQESIFPQLAVQRVSPSSNINGVAVNQPLPTTGAYFWKLYEQWNIVLDIFFCWIAPMAIPISILLILTAMTRNWTLFLKLVLFSIIVLLVGSVALSARANQAKRLI